MTQILPLCSFQSDVTKLHFSQPKSILFKRQRLYDGNSNLSKIPHNKGTRSNILTVQPDSSM